MNLPSTPRCTATLLLTAALAACSSTPLETPRPAAPTATAPAGDATIAPRPAETRVATVTLDPLDDPASGLAERSIYFAYDDATVDPKYAPRVQSHGRYLQSRPQVQVRVEGNTDERGSREYNLALGDKRAQAVARGLQLVGATGAQVEAVSYGSERPKAEGHDESAWEQNRRADIRYLKR